MDFKQWRNFNTTGEWTKELDVRGFIQANYTPYEGNSDFLASPTEGIIVFKGKIKKAPPMKFYPHRKCLYQLLPQFQMK